MLQDLFNYYFTKLDCIRKYTGKQTQRNAVCKFCITTEYGKKNSTSYTSLDMRKELPMKFSHCPFSTFKKYLKFFLHLSHYCFYLHGTCRTHGYYNISHPTDSLLRYVDDTFCILNKYHINDFHLHFNSICSHIQLTIEKEHDFYSSLS